MIGVKMKGVRLSTFLKAGAEMASSLAWLFGARVLLRVAELAGMIEAVGDVNGRMKSAYRARWPHRVVDVAISIDRCLAKWRRTYMLAA